MSIGNRKTMMNEKYHAIKVPINVMTFCCLMFEYLFNRYKTTRKRVTTSRISGIADMLIFKKQFEQNKNF